MRKISVIIPCYNVQSYISDCIYSVIDQTYKNFEIICVDDGSTDNTLTILQEFKNKYSDFITIVSTKNQGAPVARNIGLKVAKGDFIQFLDADDIIIHNKFENQLAGFTSDIDVVISDRIQKNESLTETLNTYFFSEIEDNPLETAVKRVIITSNPLYRKHIVLQLEGYDERLSCAQDWDFHIRLVLADFKIKYIPGLYFISRQVKDSISSDWIKVSIQASEIISILKQELLDSPWMNKNIQQYIAQLYMDSAIYCSDIDQSKKYITELKYWSKNNYTFITNLIQNAFIKFLGIDELIKIKRIYKKMLGR